MERIEVNLVWENEEDPTEVPTFVETNPMGDRPRRWKENKTYGFDWKDERGQAKCLAMLFNKNVDTEDNIVELIPGDDTIVYALNDDSE